MTISDQSFTEPGPDALADRAREHLWMPFARHSVYYSGTGHVPIIVKGEGAYVWDDQGRRYLDGLAGLFVVNAGHGRAEIGAAMAKQAEELAFFPIWSYAHPRAIELAERLASYAPGDLNRVFFTSGGGEAVETAWKLAKQFFKLTGKPTKHKVISRSIAYHGTPQGALSITGIPDAKIPFEPLVPGAVKVPNTNFYRAPEDYQHDEKSFGLWAANRIAEAIEFEGPDSVAAVFLEPVQNSGGCFPPPPGYLERVREICDQYDVLMVADETITSFGRIGDMFAMNRFGVTPDIITCAKGMTSGYAPMGAMIASDRLFEPFKHGTTTFLHGYTWSGHPVGAAAALANLDIFEREGINQHVVDNESSLPAHPREAERPADRRRRARGRLLLRNRAGQGQGHAGDLQRRRGRAAASRLPLQGPVRRWPVLPGRRPWRPGRPARAAADHRPARVRRDRADPPFGAHGGVEHPVTSASLPEPGSSSRTRVRRIPENAVNDRAALDHVLDAGLVAHVAVIDESGQPFVLPVAFARRGDQVLFHGSTGSRLFRSLAEGQPTCLTVTLVDGLVVALSAFESSMNYRSAMVLGVAHRLTGADELDALRCITEHLLPGRWDDCRQPKPKERAATMTLALQLDECSVKIRSGGPDDDPEDLDDPAQRRRWSGTVPLHESFGTPVRSDACLADVEVPDYIGSWRRS